jgi:hypothetical protein
MYDKDNVNVNPIEDGPTIPGGSNSPLPPGLISTSNLANSIFE